MPEHRQFLQQWVRPVDTLGERDFVDVACAGVFNPDTGVDDLHLLGVTRDGHLLHSVDVGARPASPWNASSSQWEDIESSLGRDLGEIRHVDAASRPHRSQLAVVASADSGVAWYTEGQGKSWQHLRNIVADVNAATSPFSTTIAVGEIAAAFCDADVPLRRGPDDDWELNILLEDQGDTRLLHTILAGVATQWHTSTGGVIPSPSLWRPSPTYCG